MILSLNHFLSRQQNLTSQDCLALSYDNHGNIHPTPVKQEKCAEGSKYCFKPKDSKYCQLNEQNATQYLVVCKNEDQGWYPESLINLNASSKLCDESVQSCPLKDLSEAIEYETEVSRCEGKINPPICRTLRCGLGNCLDQKQICDGIKDCHDGYDESANICKMHKEECSRSEFRCKNGKCVSKTKFCDHNNDCGDLTDEPTVCSCYTYLQ